MKKKIRIAIIFGGKSAEHEVSLRSAKNIIEAIDKRKYAIFPIGIDKAGKWLLLDRRFLASLNSQNSQPVINRRAGEEITLIPGQGAIFLISKRKKMSIDVVFPILHGPFGEDGTVQGLLKLAEVPFVGAGVVGSAIGMDKDVMKRLLRDAGIPVANFLVFGEGEKISYKKIVGSIGLPFFAKPANLGSSVGISRVVKQSEFKEAIRRAFKYDRKIILEENIKGRELECSVLGNSQLLASLPGEIIVERDFYSYRAKYMNQGGVTLAVPAKLSKKLVKDVRALTIKTFKVLACEGLARVDFFLKDNGELLVNEINTLPGFTSISMYPKLWEISGISYKELIDKLIQLALERFEKERKLYHTS